MFLLERQLILEIFIDRMEIIAIIQARLGSKRLPNKVLKKIGDLNMLQIIEGRLKKSKFINKIIFSIPDTTKNLDLLNFLQSNNLNYFCGDEKNVLKRFYDTSNFSNSKIIIRITGDNPLLDVDLIDSMIENLTHNNFDYVTSKDNIIGTGAEVFTYGALEKTFLNATKDFELEHVTPYIYSEVNHFNLNFIDSKQFFNSYIRLTIDTIEDFSLLEKINENFNNLVDLKISDIITFLEKNENVNSINHDVFQKHYLESEI